jgi:hypothetical protein
MSIWIGNTAFSLANLRICDLRINHYKFCGFAICRLTHLRNLRICDCGMSPRIFEVTICGVAICGLTKKIGVPTFDNNIKSTNNTVSAFNHPFSRIHFVHYIPPHPPAGWTLFFPLSPNWKIYHINLEPGVMVRPCFG